MFSWKGAEAQAIAEQAGMEALQLGAEMIYKDAMPLTPKKTGTLRRSFSITPVPGPGSNAVILSFNTPYARRWHEALGPVKWSEPGTGPKYLQKPFEADADKVKALINKRVRDALRGHA